RGTGEQERTARRDLAKLLRRLRSGKRRFLLRGGDGHLRERESLRPRGSMGGRQGRGEGRPLHARPAAAGSALLPGGRPWGGDGPRRGRERQRVREDTRGILPGLREDRRDDAPRTSRQGVQDL